MDSSLTSLSAQTNPTVLLIAYFLFFIVLLLFDSFLAKVAFRRSEVMVDLCLYSLLQQIPISVGSVVTAVAVGSVPDALRMIAIQAICVMITLVFYLMIRNEMAKQHFQTKAHVLRVLTPRRLPNSDGIFCLTEKIIDHMIDVDFLHDAKGILRPFSSLDPTKQEKRRLFVDSLPPTAFDKKELEEKDLLVPDSSEKTKSALLYVAWGLLSLIPLFVCLLYSYFLTVAASS